MKQLFLFLGLISSAVAFGQCNGFDFSITGAPGSVCGGSSINFNVVVTGDDELYEITTEINGATVSVDFGEPGSNNISVIPDQTGVVEIIVYVSDGVGGMGGCQEMDSFDVLVESGDNLFTLATVYSGCGGAGNSAVFFAWPEEQQNFGEYISIDWTPSLPWTVISQYAGNWQFYGVPEGTYTVTFSDYGGNCGNSSVTVVVEEDPLGEPDLEVSNIFMDNNNCEFDGQFNVTVTRLVGNSFCEFCYDYFIDGEQVFDYTVEGLSITFENLSEGCHDIEFIPGIYQFSLCPFSATVCSDDINLGCSDPEACNYEEGGQCPGVCVYAPEISLAISGTCSNEANGSLVLSSEEIQAEEWAEISIEALNGELGEMTVNPDGIQLSGLQGGSYTILLLSEEFCLEDEYSFEVPFFNSPAIEYSVEASCPGFENGAVTFNSPDLMADDWLGISVTSQEGEFEFSGTVDEAGLTFNQLPEGTYTLELVQEELCLAEIVQFEINETDGSPSLILADIIPPASCFDTYEYQIIVETADGSDINLDDWYYSFNNDYPGNWYSLEPASFEVNGSTMTFGSFNECYFANEVYFGLNSGSGSGLCPSEIFFNYEEHILEGELIDPEVIVTFDGDEYDGGNAIVQYTYPASYDISYWTIDLFMDEFDIHLDEEDAVVGTNVITFSNLPLGFAELHIFNGCDNSCGAYFPVELEPTGELGDFDGDGQIGAEDLLILLGEYGCMSDCLADLNGDGIVTVIDLLQFLVL